ncbi:GNAT family N-acetyltransferase [Actinotalea soli]|uniref:GNAT family N-acetyltransferase n=1 Tax=Actinotalea soli TaxID=2819234 RepID=UPI0027DC32C6|nr:GNAT family N-acetyltransferase [Actinotalea soli]
MIVRDASREDVAAICAFGREHVPPHYEPLIGRAAAQAQVERWWGSDHVSAATTDGRVVVAEDAGQVVGVGQRGPDHVVYKLYVHPGHRGTGLGPRLIEALERQLPPGVGRLSIEHFAANQGAARFYEREGFAVDRVEPSPTGVPGLAVVWRSRPVGRITDRPRPQAEEPRGGR